MQDPTEAPTEREKWQAEEARKTEELALRRREVELREQDSLLARLSNPLSIAVVGAFLAAVTNIWVTAESSKQQREMERLRNEAAQAIEKNKAESQLVLEMIKTASADKAAANLSFLVETGLLTNQATRDAITKYVKARPAGDGVSLPVPTSLSDQSGKAELSCTSRGADIDKVAEQLDALLQKFGTLVRLSPWSISPSGRSRRISAPGGAHGYDAVVSVDSVDDGIVSRLSGDLLLVNAVNMEELLQALAGIPNVASTGCGRRL